MRTRGLTESEVRVYRLVCLPTYRWSVSIVTALHVLMIFLEQPSEESPKYAPLGLLLTVDSVCSLIYLLHLVAIFYTIYREKFYVDIVFVLQFTATVGMLIDLGWSLILFSQDSYWSVGRGSRLFRALIFFTTNRVLCEELYNFLHCTDPSL